MRRTMERVDRFTDNMRNARRSDYYRVQILLDDTQPKISEMVADAAHVVYLARGQAQKLDRVVSEASDRLRGQLVAADRILTGALETVEEAGSQFKRGHLEAGAKSFRRGDWNQSGTRFLAVAARPRSALLRRSRRARRRTVHLKLQTTPVCANPNTIRPFPFASEQ